MSEARWAQELSLPVEVVSHLMGAVRPVAASLLARGRPGTPLAIAVSGAQGSGKSTFAHLLAAELQGAHGQRVAGLSLDDLYMTRAQRASAASAVHPELETRGLPGTHDLPLAETVFDGLLDPSGREVALPVFDKAADDRFPESAFRHVRGPFDAVLLEGWCVGARPQPPAALDEPINDFERTRDPEGALRRHVDAALAGPYAALFGRFEQLVMLRVPDMDCVRRFRTDQEHALRRRLREAGREDTAMTDAQVVAFVDRFERITRHMLEEMPARADFCVQLDAAHRVVSVSGCGSEL